MIYMIGIEVCCPGMRTMIQDGTMRPYVSQGSDTGEMIVEGKNNRSFHYNQVRHCPSCGMGIRVIDR